MIHACVDESVVTRNSHNQKKWQVKCPGCGEVKQVSAGNVRRGVAAGTFTGLCRKCNGDRGTGPAHSQWKGGSYVCAYGYRLIWVAPTHPLAAMRDCRGYIREHRLIMANHLGYVIEADIVVHHVDEDKLNNDISNLRLMTNKAHGILHNG